MKDIKTPKILPLFTLIAGILGFFLRLWLFQTGVDRRGLLDGGHVAGTLSFLLLAVFLAVLFVCIRPLNALDQYSKLFPASVLPAIGCVAAAAGLLISNLPLAGQDLFALVQLILAVVSAVCLLVLAFCRFKGIRPNFLLHVLVTVYLMVNLIAGFRAWGAEPELQRYFFPLLASVLLMLTSYHAALMDAKKTSRRWFVFCSQAACLCCCMSLTDENWLFYLTMALWCLTGLCSLRLDEPQTEEA